MHQGKVWVYVLIIFLILIIGGFVYYLYFWWPKMAREGQISGPSKAAENWVKNPNVLFEDVTSTDTIKLDDGTFRMFMQKDGNIQYADSKDATIFSAPVSTGIDEKTGAMISNPAVLKIAESNWIMVYEEQQKLAQTMQYPAPLGPKTQRNLLLATSTDGKNFNKAGIAIDSSKDKGDNYFASVPDLIKIPGGQTIRMYYVCGGEAICSAKSNDGRTWVKEEGIRAGDKAVDPNVLTSELQCFDCEEPIKWVMYATALTGNNNKIYKYTSSDGLKWEKGAAVLSSNSEKGAIVDPDVIEIAPGKWRMFFGEMADSAGLTGDQAQINLYYADFEGDIF